MGETTSIKVRDRSSGKSSEIFEVSATTSALSQSVLQGVRCLVDLRSHPYITNKIEP